MIVYQNANQRERTAQFGQKVVFLDATYKGMERTAFLNTPEVIMKIVLYQIHFHIENIKR